MINNRIIKETNKPKDPGMFIQCLNSPLAILMSIKEPVSPIMYSNSHCEFTIIIRAVASVFISTWQMVMKNVAKKVSVREVGSFLI